MRGIGDMQTVVLAGGLGTRLRSLEPVLPKPLVKVGGRPFLEHLVAMLARRGLRRFLFLLAYRCDMVIEFLRDGRWKGLDMRWSIEPEPMGTGGALRLARPLLDGEFLLVNGDSYLDFDYADFTAAFRRGGTDALMAVYDNARPTDVPNNVAVNARGLVARYAKSGGGELTHVDAGVVAARKTVLDLLPAEGKCNVEAIYPALIGAGRIGAYATDCRFFDIGTPRRLAEFERLVTHDNIANTV